MRDGVNLAIDILRPDAQCILPTAGAKTSTLVSATNCAASSEVVSCKDSAGTFSTISEEAPILTNFAFYEKLGPNRFQDFDGPFRVRDVLLKGLASRSSSTTRKQQSRQRIR